MDTQELIGRGLQIVCCLVAMMILLEFEDRMARRRRREKAKNRPGPV